MSRTQSRYVCQSCGAAVLRWEGQCRTCGEWNTLVETVVRDAASGTARLGGRREREARSPESRG